MPCDLIVMGSHGRAGLKRLLTGSVAEEVLRKAVCPLLVVKTPLWATLGAEKEATANPGDPIDVRPLGAALVSAHTRKVVRTPTVDVVRLIVRAAQEIPQHTNKGELLIHCLEGRVAITALGKTMELEPKTLLHLPAGEPHALFGIEDASLLVTIVVPQHQ
jgi:quercetin dioxygenase-like cupin family protein